MTPDPTVETIRFPVRGMSCASCVNRIMRAVGRIDGVTRVRVDLRTETAAVRREPALVSNAALAAAVAEAGFEADVDAAVVVPAAADRSFLDRIVRRAT